LKKQQLLLVGSGVVLLCLIYFFGRTIPPKKEPGTAAVAATSSKEIDVNSILAASRQQLTASQQAYVAQLETAVVRGDVKEQQAKVYKQLAAFWRDSAHLLLPYGYYTAEAAKLENSQKSLTFAAQFFLDGIRRQENPDLQRWMALEAKGLFEKALQLDPGNDSLKVGLGSCYLFGNISETPMEGIAMIREVAQRNPDNMYAQFMLGMGGMISGQFDKVIERMGKVVQHEPDNVEAILILAEAYERTGDKANAIKWYETGKKYITNADVKKEIDDRIKLLRK
jgi:thioredoxin-like negative regulator of GroEL